MAGRSSPDDGNRKTCSLTVSTKLLRIAALAREDSKRVLTTLAHHIDVDWLALLIFFCDILIYLL